MAVFLGKEFDQFISIVMNLKKYSRQSARLIVYFYVSGIWDKELSQFNKKSYRENTYERVQPDIMYSFFMPVLTCRFISGLVSVFLHSVLHFKN